MGFTAFNKQTESNASHRFSHVTPGGSGHAQLVPNPTLLEDISQLIRLIANALEAHSVFFLIPAKQHPGLKNPGLNMSVASDAANSLSQKRDGEASEEMTLIPLTSHTLSPEALAKAQLPISSGPLCWVSRTGRPLQIAPFESDARILGVYGKGVELKSLAAIPIPLPALTVEELQQARSRKELSAFGHRIAEARRANGVLVVDSLKSYSFTDQKIKLLSQLGDQLKRLLELHSAGTANSLLFDNSEKPERDSHESDIKATLCSLVERYELSGLSMISVSMRPESNGSSTHDRASDAQTTKGSAMWGSFWRNSGERSSSEKESDKSGSAERADALNWRSLFPAGRLLALSRKIEKLWQEACSDIVSELSAESATGGATAPHMILHSSNRLVVVGDHLLARHLVAKMKSTLSLHLKRELVHIIKDPRGSVFHELASQIFSFREQSLAALINQESSSERRSLEEDWISHTLNQLKEVAQSQKSKHQGSRKAGNTFASRKSAPQFHRVQHELQDIDANRAAPSPTQAEHAFRMPEMEGSSGAELEDLQLHSGATLRTQERMRA